MNTEIIKIEDGKGDISTSELSLLKKAAEILKSGGLVVFPTETVYGLGGDATNPSASEKIYKAKGRPSDNPLIIHISRPEDAEKYAYTTDIYYKLAERFMPGPITVILKARGSVPEKTRGGLETVAVRCPENKIANKLIELAGVAIAAPSANLSGSPSPTKASHVIDDMMGRVDMIIDGGECDIGLESTIVKADEDGSLCLLRPGGITVDELSEIAPVRLADAVVNKLKDGEVAISPGMKYRHYAPKAPLVLLDGDISDAISYIGDNAKGRVAVVCYTEDKESICKALPNVTLLELGELGDFDEHAHRLFDILREADKMCFDIIFAPLPEKRGIGLALYNRMIRAAAHTIINLRR
ncbi:MAG: threonylcarbamoyl-AMP synthase [Clostridia bacterium]|nr:threonylcarbamoyl-AMP synthase [Clostridia bacterium]